MAKSIKLSAKKVWVGFRQKPNDSLVVRGFEDILISDDGDNFIVQESADSRAQAFMNATQESKLLEGALSAEHAVEIANQKRI